MMTHQKQIKVVTGKRPSRRQQRLEEQAKAARLKQIRIIGVVVLIVGAIAAFAIWRHAGVVPVAEVVAATEPNLLGSATAPVRIVEFGDFGCTTCRAWHNAGIMERLVADYGDQIAFEFRHFPVITAQSPQAAEAGQCAAEQDAFWPYHDYIYESTPQGALATADLKGYATAVGLDRPAFDACLDSGKYRDFVALQKQEARDWGATGTPSFFLDGRPLSFSYQSMAAAIEAALGGS